MQVAKLFASLGFKIDTADLSHFESLLNKAQGEMSQFAKDLNFVNQKLKTMKNRFGQANDALKDTDIAKAADRVAKAVDKYVKNAKEIVDIDGKVERVFKDTGVRLDLLSNKLDGGTSAWNRYEQQVKEATARMREFTAAARERQSVNPPRGTGAGSGANQGGGAGGRGSGGRGNNGYDEQGGMSGMLLGGQKFGKAFVGQMAMGGALGAGYAIKEIVQTGREVQKMEQMLLQASTTTEDFEQNLSFVHKMAEELKIAFDGAGFAYAKILSSTSDSNLTKKNKEDLIYGLSKYMRTVNLADYDQAGVYKQIGQMFNNQRIQQDELNSIAERGIPIAKFMRQAVKELGMTQAQYVKEQEAGKADPIKYMPIVARLMKEAANNNGAYEKSLRTSLAAQSDFMNSMKKMSSELLKNGLDKYLKGMFDALTFLVETLTPIVVGAIEMISWFISLVKILIELPLGSWVLIFTYSLIGLGFALMAGGKAALFAGGTITSLTSALKLLRAALPIAALLGLLWVLGEITKWKKDQADGIETFTWLDLASAKLQLFFSIAELGWLNFKLATIEARNAVRDLLSLKPQKAIDFIKDYGDDIGNRFVNISPAGRGANFLYDQIMGRIQEARIPVDVNVNVKMPDGSVQSSTTSSSTGITVGGMGSTP